MDSGWTWLLIIAALVASRSCCGVAFRNANPTGDILMIPRCISDHLRQLIPPFAKEPVGKAIRPVFVISSPFNTATITACAESGYPRQGILFQKRAASVSANKKSYPYRTYGQHATPSNLSSPLNWWLKLACYLYRLSTFHSVSVDGTIPCVGRE